MKPTEFEGSNVVFAKDQPEYLPLPALYDQEAGRVVSCWQLTWRERMRMLVGGKLYLAVLTFGDPLQPLLPGARQVDVM